MALATGDRIGSFEVLSALGAGGMGEVYRARDATLKRDVALKILPELFALDPDRLARFKREAQVLASLNHPNIAAIYGFEDSNLLPGSGRAAVKALVLELVEGPTLADRIARGPIPVDEAVPIARQIAEALEAAHEQGIIHRDLKPANIKITQRGSSPAHADVADGVVKVLDFGLAKALEPAGMAVGDATASPTVTSPALTHMGVILGTAAYMSPEQAKGRQADKRSDVWAFGAVFYEMLTGQRAFKGDDVADSLALVLRGEPDWAALPPDVPPPIRLLLRRCLAKDRRQRIADMSVALFAMSDDAGRLLLDLPVGTRHKPPLWKRLAAPALAAVLAGAAVGTAVWLGTRPVTPRVTRFAFLQAGDPTLIVDQQSRDLTITPDGRRIVYKGATGAGTTATQLFVRSLDTLELRPLTAPGTPRAPFSSPDSQWIGFVEPGPVTLKKIAISGGAPFRLCALDGPSRGATWGDDGTIIFATAAPATGLQRVSSDGGEPTILTTPDRDRGDSDHLWPQFLPGSRAVLFTITATAGGIDASRVAVLDLGTAGATPKIVVTGGSQAQYVSSGHLVYAHGSTLRAVAFDLERLQTIGTPMPVVAPIVALANGTAEFDVARNGTLVYVAGDVLGPPTRTLVWVDRQGREEAIKGAPARSFVAPRLSPDGTRVALDVRDGENDIWVWDFARGTLERVTTDPGVDHSPVWTRDGQRLVFSSQTGGSVGTLFMQSADGSGPAVPLTQSSNPQRPSDVASDGSILFWEGRGSTIVDIMWLRPEKDRRVEPLLETPFSERNGEISPNGRWLAHESNESGQLQVVVRPFPDVNRQKWQVSSPAGGTHPAWARNGKELFYLAPTGALMSVPVGEGDEWSPGTPATVIAKPYLRLGGAQVGRTYDVSLDGKRFLMIKPSSATEGRATGVAVENWFEELKRLVPTGR